MRMRVNATALRMYTEEESNNSSKSGIIPGSRMSLRELCPTGLQIGDRRPVGAVYEGVSELTAGTEVVPNASENDPAKAGG
jgi:hypothetical protein